jgi:hypothetical protein
MSKRANDRSPEIALILSIVKSMYQRQGITFGV